MPLSLRQIGPRDYYVIEDGQRIGRIRWAKERIPGVWLWSVQVHLPGGLPMGTAKDLDAAKVAFKLAWEAFKAKHGPYTLAGLQGDECSRELGPFQKRAVPTTT